jgi:hypothetical protein
LRKSRAFNLLSVKPTIKSINLEWCSEAWRVGKMWCAYDFGEKILFFREDKTDIYTFCVIAMSFYLSGPKLNWKRWRKKKRETYQWLTQIVEKTTGRYMTPIIWPIKFNCKSFLITAHDCFTWHDSRHLCFRFMVMKILSLSTPTVHQTICDCFFMGKKKNSIYRLGK